MRENAKTLKKPQAHNLARNFKDITISLDSNHFNIIYQKVLCATFRGKQIEVEAKYV